MCPTCRPPGPQRTLIAKLDELITMMVKNEHDRELSPYWRHHDGSMLTRAECVAAGNPFEGPDDKSSPR